LYEEDDWEWEGVLSREEPTDGRCENSLSRSERPDLAPSPRPGEDENEENSLSMSDSVERIPEDRPPTGSLSLPRADG